LKGIAVVLPAFLEESANAELTDEILAALNIGSRLPVSGIGEWTIKRVRAGQYTTTLDPRTWTRRSAQWATATPLVLNRHPGHLFGRAAQTEVQVEAKEKARKEAEESVIAACLRIKLPRPLRVELSRFSPIRGVPPSHRFRPPPRHGGKPQRWHVHAKIVFAKPVRGPILIGAGRYFGYGLCKPISGES